MSPLFSPEKLSAAPIWSCHLHICSSPIHLSKTSLDHHSNAIILDNIPPPPSSNPFIGCSWHCLPCHSRPYIFTSSLLSWVTVHKKYFSYMLFLLHVTPYAIPMHPTIQPQRCTALSMPWLKLLKIIFQLFVWKTQMPPCPGSLPNLPRNMTVLSEFSWHLSLDSNAAFILTSILTLGVLLSWLNCNLLQSRNNVWVIFI